MVIYKRKKKNLIKKASDWFQILIDPATGRVIAEVTTGTVQDYDECVKTALDAYKTWSNVPAPRRGEIVRQIGNALRKNLQPLGKLVSLGKY